MSNNDSIKHPEAFEPAKALYTQFHRDELTEQRDDLLLYILTDLVKNEKEAREASELIKQLTDYDISPDLAATIYRIITKVKTRELSPDYKILR